VFAFAAAVLGQLDLGRAAHDVHRGAVVQIAAFLALQPDVFSFCGFGHSCNPFRLIRTPRASAGCQKLLITLPVVVGCPVAGTTGISDTWTIITYRTKSVGKCSDDVRNYYGTDLVLKTK